MKFINFSIVKFSLFLTIGIIVSYFHSTPFYFHYFGISIVILFAFWLIARKQLFQTFYFGFFTYLSIFFLGTVLFQLHLPEFKKNHYTNYSESTLLEKPIQLKISEILKDNLFNHKYIAKVNAIDGLELKGKILLNISKDSTFNQLEIDDIILVTAKIKRIPHPLNPHQFDFAKYMKSLEVTHQLQIKKQSILKQYKGKSTIRGVANKFRSNIIDKIEKSTLTKDELAIVKALILGQKKDISKQVLNEYAAAGAIHILAVSGLHVGILYFILLFILKPLKHLTKNNVLISLIVVLALWGFAFLTGLSPSVIRAVTMFSFFAFAKIINRETNSINTLFLSYFFLLLINPLWLFQVGFQLSYLAVFFILWLLPFFNKIYYPKNRFIKKVWGILTVTLAAQIGIIPLSLYYFHQFPGLFFLTNLIVLPFLELILGGGILFIVLSLFNINLDWYFTSYGYLIKMLNSFISWIANQDLFLIEDISFSLNKVLVWYLFIGLLFTFFKIYNRKSFINLLIGITLVFSVSIADKITLSQNELVVFHKNKQSLVANKFGNDLEILKIDSTQNLRHSYPLKSYGIHYGIEQYTNKLIPDIFNYNETTLLVIDSLGIYPDNNKIDFVLLTFSPKLNLNRMIDILQPKLIIADGSNYKSYVKRWSKSCEKNNIKFHFTGINGAYILK